VLGLALVEVFLNASVLCVILYAVARHEADYSFSKVAMVSAGLVTGSLLLRVTMLPHLSDDYHWLLYPAIFLFTAFVLMTFCWITFWKSVLVIVLFSCWQVGTAVITAYAKQQFNNDTDRITRARDSQKEELDLIRQEMQRQASNASVRAKTAGRNRIEKRAPASKTDPIPARRPALKKDTGPAASAADWRQAKKNIRVGGTIVFKGRTCASINGRIVEEDDLISAEYKGRNFSWKVKSISSSGIHLEQAAVTPEEQ
jgi:uncharacterized membrane protein